MNRSKTHTFLSITLLGTLIVHHEMLDAYSSSNKSYRPSDNDVEQIRIQARQKYSTPYFLDKYKVSYQQVNDITEAACKKLCQERTHVLQPFEDELDNRIQKELHAHAEKQKTVHYMSYYDLQRRIENHALQLRKKYGQSSELQYFNVSYQDVANIINHTKDTLFGGINNIVTTEAQLNELFKEWTRNVINELHKHKLNSCN